jgi:hypothetical protein
LHKGKKIYVGDLGEAVISSKGFIDAHYVLEEDGTKSWQLLPDEHSDTWLKTVKVIPLETEGLELTKKQKELVRSVK